MNLIGAISDIRYSIKKEIQAIEGGNIGIMLRRAQTRQVACVPGCGGKSILRYPSLKVFFHNCLITNDLKSTKA
jgi:hypothetical protein